MGIEQTAQPEDLAQMKRRILFGFQVKFSRQFTFLRRWPTLAYQ